MAKRFTDSDKYKDPWFRKLSPVCKTLFMFMCDDCNHAGVWKENLDTFNFIYKASATVSDLDEMSEKIARINKDTYLIHSFIKFQYGELNPLNKAHLGVIRALNYAGIDYTPYLAPSKELPSPQGIGTGEGNGERAGIGLRNGKGMPSITNKEIPF